MALIPGESVRQQVREFQESAAQLFGSRRALRSPPHITLEPPFKWRPECYPALDTCLQQIASGQTAFTVSLQGFDCFRRNRVIYLAVGHSPELIKIQSIVNSRLRAELKLVSDRPERPFHPHLTVAFRDLSKSRFTDAWTYFSQVEFNADFTADSLTLLEHDGRGWQPHRSYGFSEPQ